MLRQLLRNSIRAKVAAVFIVFALFFAIQGALVVFFYNRANAVSLQIEIIFEAEEISQVAYSEFKEYIANNEATSLPGEFVSMLNKGSNLLNTVLRGGRAGNSDKSVPPASGIAISSIEKVIRLDAKQKASLISLSAFKGANASLSSTTDSMENTISEERLQRITKDMIETDGQSKSLASAYEQLIEDLREVEGNRQANLVWLIIIVVSIDIGVLAYFFILMSQKIFKPLKEIADAARQQQLSTTQTTDELGLVATNLNSIINQLSETTDFIKAIGEGNLDAKLVGENKNSSLSQALLSMQQKLKAINDEDRKRQWANEGLAKFIEILRSGESNLSALGDKIIKALVSYTGSNQGGLYIWNDDQPDNPYIELIASYAFNRKKYDQKIIKSGEGLLGQAYLEKTTVYLTQIPPDYFRIESGLGEIDPQSILIVPLLSDGNVYGLVEMASFKKFEPHEIAFVEKQGEAVASTLASVKTNQKNRKLLEEFQEQTENMRSQEEEMRQNMEELTATQEEMGRKENEYINRIEELQEKLRQASADGEWEIAHQASEALQTNLQALNISLQAFKDPN